MLADKNAPASHAGEDQSSPDVFATRETHWKCVLAGLLNAARTLGNTYLQDERESVRECIDADHHKAVIDLFAQIKRAEALGLSVAGAAQLAATGHAKVDLWSANVAPFSACSLSDLICQNDWLRPGDFVYKAETVFQHLLTEADFTAAAAPTAIGGEQ